MQQSLFELAPTLTVAQLIRQIKDVVESDGIFAGLAKQFIAGIL